MTRRGAPEGALAVSPPSSTKEEVTTPWPTVGAVRAARGLPPIEPTPGLERKIEIAEAAWQHWKWAAAHLVVAAAIHHDVAWAQDELARWAREITFADLRELADGLLDEALDHARRAS